MLLPPAHAVSTLGVKPVGCENTPPESSGTEEQTEDLKVFSLDGPVCAPRERSAGGLVENEEEEECEDADEPLHHLLALRSRLGRRERGAQQAAG